MTGNRFEKAEGRVRVEVDGVAMADSTRVIALHEGTLPVRYYFPKDDVVFEHLKPSDTVTTCHWKGQARYWSAHVGDSVHEDLLWGYDDPLPGATEITGRVSFYNHRVEILLDR